MKGATVWKGGDEEGWLQSLPVMGAYFLPMGHTSNFHQTEVVDGGSDTGRRESGVFRGSSRGHCK
jgi:hypothetical protein